MTIPGKLAGVDQSLLKLAKEATALLPALKARLKKESGKPDADAGGLAHLRAAVRELERAVGLVRYQPSGEKTEITHAGGKLRKAKKGEQQAGHKYKSRKRDPKTGEWVYTYDEPAAQQHDMFAGPAPATSGALPKPAGATKKQIKVTCERCGGSGQHSYNAKDGDMCYGCGGKGHNLSTEAAEAAKAKRRAAAHEKAFEAKGSYDARVAEANARIAKLAEFYRDRIDAELVPLHVPPGEYYYKTLQWYKEDLARIGIDRDYGHTSDLEEDLPKLQAAAAAPPIGRMEAAHAFDLPRTKSRALNWIIDRAATTPIGVGTEPHVFDRSIPEDMADDLRKYFKGDKIVEQGFVFSLLLGEAQGGRVKTRVGFGKERQAAQPKPMPDLGDTMARAVATVVTTQNERKQAVVAAAKQLPEGTVFTIPKLEGIGDLAGKWEIAHMSERLTYVHRVGKDGNGKNYKDVSNFFGVVHHLIEQLPAFRAAYQEPDASRKSHGAPRLVLRKARQGDMKAGHKYTSRHKGPDGEWIYNYEHPTEGGHGGVPAFGDMLNTLAGKVQAYLKTGKPLQIGTATKIFPLTNPADIRAAGGSLQHRWNGKWVSLVDEQAELLAHAVGAMGPMSHARAGGERPREAPAPSAGAIFDQFQEEMGRFDTVYNQFTGARAESALSVLRETHAADLDAIALAYERKKKITAGEATAALNAARSVVRSAKAMLAGLTRADQKRAETVPVKAAAFAKKIGPIPAAPKPLAEMDEAGLKALQAQVNAYREPFYDLPDDVRGHQIVSDLEGGAGRLGVQAGEEIQRQKRAAKRAQEKPENQKLSVANLENGQAVITLFGDPDQPVIAGPFPDEREAKINMHMLAEQKGYKVVRTGGGMVALFSVGAKRSADMQRKERDEDAEIQAEAARRLAELAGGKKTKPAPRAFEPIPVEPAPAAKPTPSVSSPPKKHVPSFGDVGAMNRYKTRKSLAPRGGSGRFAAPGSRDHMAAHRKIYVAKKQAGEISGTRSDWLSHLQDSWTHEKDTHKIDLLGEYRHLEADSRGMDDGPDLAKVKAKLEKMRKTLARLGHRV